MQTLPVAPPLPTRHLALRHEWKGIQILRAVAAIMVVIFHALRQYPRLDFLGGGTGVDIFFAISGFVMVISTQQLRSSPNPFSLFMKRRIIRIMPLYWVMTVVTLALFLLGNGSNAHSLQPAYILGSVFLFPVWREHSPAGPADWHPVVNPGWTLSFEMLFYLMFALTLRSRRQTILLSGALGLLVVLGVFFPPESGRPAILNLLSPKLLEFLGGVYIGKLALRGRVLNVWAAFLIVVAFLLAIFTLPGSAFFWKSAALGCLCTMLVLAAVSLEPYLHSYAPRWLVYLGNASYSIYLSHFLMLNVFFFRVTRRFEHGGVFTSPVIPLTGIFISIGLGCLLSEYLEYPLHRSLMKRFGGVRARLKTSQLQSA